LKPVCSSGHNHRPGVDRQQHFSKCKLDVRKTGEEICCEHDDAKNKNNSTATITKSLKRDDLSPAETALLADLRTRMALPRAVDKSRRFIDLGHTVEHGMITYKGMPGPVVSDYRSRQASKDFYAQGTEFHIGRIEMVANTGTYVDAPFHRFA